jgi:hypothetical protein
VFVLPDAEIGGCDAALRNDGCGLKENQARAALRAAAQVNQMPIAGKAMGATPMRFANSMARILTGEKSVTFIDD